MTPPLPGRSYDQCEGSEAQAWSGLDPQLVTACPDRPPPLQRAAWGLHAGQGRGAPEFDVFEIGEALVPSWEC